MSKKIKQTSISLPCAKCQQTDLSIDHPQLILTGTQGGRAVCVTLCPACLQMFWLVYDGFIQTRPATKPIYTQPPKGFRAAFAYHQQRHVEAIHELEKEIIWHRQGIQYIREMPSELSAPHPHP